MGQAAKGLINAGRLNGVTVRVHWSLLAGCIALALVAWPQVLSGLAAVFAYFMSMLIHEWGHTFVAQRRRCPVHAIELYPMLGLARLGQPYSHADHCAIAWAGVVAQAIAATPMVAILATVGFTPISSVNYFLVVFVWVSVLSVVLNLVPIRPLDGALAWSRVPALPRFPRWLRPRKTRPMRGWNKPGRTASR